MLQTPTPLPPAHPGWERSAWCPSVTPWPLLALLSCRTDTVGLLSPDQAWGQTFWGVMGRGMGWWCHRGCRRVACRIGGGLSRGSQSHTRLTVLFTANGHPVWNRAPFDGLKQCLMTLSHLIRLTRLQKYGIRGHSRGDDEGKMGKTPGPLTLE